MSKKDKTLYSSLVAIWLVSLIYFWHWWFQPQHLSSQLGTFINSALILWTMIMPGYYFFFVYQMKRPNPRIKIPQTWRVAMVVTKAPSEPLSIVQKTLLAMLRQKHPHDTWVADEDPTAQALSWYRKNGIKVSCRRGIPDYHRSEWPRRTKCKEGNLAYFYDKYGYKNYDIVVQMDVDHVPQAGYLKAMIRPFVDGKVGYVAAPSICDANLQVSWAVRARAYAEATMHGSLQAGYNNGWAPLCIGSHYAVRTKALKEIGGLGPELAEDHTTTLMMNSSGWKGIFAFDARAHGDGAVNFGDSMLQEFQWSKSLVKVLLTITRKYWKNLPLKLKFQFGFAQLWYPIFSLTMLFSFLLPSLAILRNRAWVNIDYLSFIAHSSLPSLMCLIIVAWIKRKGWLRPKNAKVISWETVLFQLARWPWVLVACFDALISVLLRKDSGFKVTPKGQGGGLLSSRLIVPYFALVIFAISIVFFGQDRPSNRGYFYLSLMSSLSYGLLLLNLLWLHRKDVLRAGEKILLKQWLPQIGLGLATIGLLSLGLQSKGEEAVTAVLNNPPITTHSKILARVLPEKGIPQPGVILSVVDDKEDEVVQAKEYTIKPGDNLWKISMNEYHNGLCWQVIWESNQDQLKSTRTIQSGTTVIIPTLKPQDILACSSNI